MSRMNVVGEVGLPFLWLGMVLAISFLEAPLKFRAPGITIPLGLGIGRLVFRALNGVEIVLAVLLIVAVATGDASLAAWLLVAAAAVILAVQLVGLRPTLDRRAVRILAGNPPPPSRLHVAYIVLEVIKAAVLAAVGIVLAGYLLP